MNQNEATVEGLSIQEILRHLPHRYPFLLVDRVQSYVPGKTLTAIKNITANEPFFSGHFPGRPILPGVLILEAIAQAAAILGFISKQQPADDRSLYLLVGVDKARFRRQVTPGDQLHIVVDILNCKRGIWKFEAQVEVDGEIVCNAELMSADRRV